MEEIVRGILVAFDYFVLGYFLVLNTLYLFLTALAAVAVARTWRSTGIEGTDDIFANPLTPAVSVVVPAFNEESSVVDSARSILGLRYPELEVIVVDDGSTDATFERLRVAFDLVKAQRVVPGRVPSLGRVLGVYRSRANTSLVVVRKENTGRRSDPLNVGIDVARCPLVCMVDADSVLDEDALLRVVKPFVEDPVRVVAVGGVVRAANGSRIEGGRVVAPRMPDSWVARIQVLEYLRSFLFGRTAWAKLGGLLIISGAFGIFRRDLLVSVGGLDLDTVGEDAELVTRLHRTLRRAGEEYRIAFVAEPVCWSEVPSTLRMLGRQRRRWGRGLAEVLWKHRRMVGNPRFGFIGSVVLPYYVVFELLGAIVELFGVLAVTLGLVLGLVNLPFALLFVAVAFGYAIFLSVAALALEEFSFHRYPGWHDLVVALGAAVLENVGYRQLHAWWRLRGLAAAVVGKPAEWQSLTRHGFQAGSDPGPAGREGQIGCPWLRDLSRGVHRRILSRI